MRVRAIGDDDQLLRAIRSMLAPLVESVAPQQFAPVIKQIDNATLVMLGSASDGTHQFQQARAAISRLLIEEKGFNAVAIEADWPDADRVRRYVLHQSEDRSADEALANFQSFPSWLWRNQEVADFVEWLRQENHRRDADSRISFYGLDLYSHCASVDAVMHYLGRWDRQAAQEARYRYSCFEQFDQDPQQYGYTLNDGLSPQHKEEMIAQLVARSQRTLDNLDQAEFLRGVSPFSTERIERLRQQAEAYQRELFRGRNNGWNLREQHLFDSLRTLIEPPARQGSQPKIIVWTHNSHVGDARFTEMSTRGEFNLGQLVKEAYGDKAFAVGFTTYEGTVAAAAEWGDAMEERQMRPALPESYEALFHSLGERAFALNLHAPAIHEDLRKARLERAIGAVYRPQTERISHYFYTQLSQQFDLVIHFDHTDAVVPL